MKYTNNADGSTTIQYTKLEAQKYQHYRGRCEEMLKRFSRPDDMERVYNVLVALAEIGAEGCDVVMEEKDELETKSTRTVRNKYLDFSGHKKGKV